MGGNKTDMPRVVKLNNPKEYRGFKVNDKYNYDKEQLNKIVDALEFYHELSVKDSESNYMVFDITVNVEDYHVTSEDLDDVFFDPSSLRFNPSTIQENVLTPDKFYFRWTREYKTKYGAGLHYHFMVIANNINRSKVMELCDQIKELDGVRSVYCAPRQNAETPFHYLNRIGDNGLDDAVLRHCYRAKLNQKLAGDLRTFDGSRGLKALLPSSPRRRLFS